MENSPVLRFLKPLQSIIAEGFTYAWGMRPLPQTEM
jgi:hypothetical protein